MGAVTEHEPSVRRSVAARLYARGRYAGDAHSPPAARRASRRRMKRPRTTPVRQRDTHRLIPSRRSRIESVLTLIADDDRHLADVFELDHATNDRLSGEHDLLPGIGIR